MRYERSRRRLRPTLITSIIALAAQACGSAESSGPPGGGPSGAGGASGAASASNAGAKANAGDGSAHAGALTILDPGPPPVPPNSAVSCPTGDLLAEQAVRGIGHRVLYSWTTDEQVAELRAGGPLFSRSESPGKGRGLAMTQLTAYGAKGSGLVNQLAAALADRVFAKARFAWPNPWATLMGWPGETYGNQLLQISLRPEAWIAFFYDTGGLAVYDLNHQAVDLETAAANPDRIGAIYYQSEVDREGQHASCYEGTFSQGGVAFREFVLGNLQMVQSWSLATPEIAARLQSDITALEAFAAGLDCSDFPSQAEWAAEVVCASDLPAYGLHGSRLNYDLALGLPSELYYPTRENIAAIVAALKVSLPQGEPLTVTPGG